MARCKTFLFRLMITGGVLIQGMAAAAADVQVLPSFDYDIRVTTIADGLEEPWAMAVLPNGDILITEQPGRLRLVRAGTLVEEPVAGTPEVGGRLHSGLMDVALHPDFAGNGLVYLSHSRINDKGSTVVVTRARLDGMRLVNPEEVFEAFAWEPRELNYGSRVAFDNEGYLYITIGDRGPDGEPKAQDLAYHHGKTVRLHDDGRVPADNPFVNTPGALPEIFSYGHRNQQGLVLNPVTGEMWASEHGPRGGDEVNVLKAGGNYGWPVVSFGRTYDGEQITDDPMQAGMVPPQWYWVPSIGISDILYYDGDAFPAWKNRLIVTGMSGMMLQTVLLEGRGARERESLLTSLRQQFRDVDVDADGNLFVLARHDADNTPNSGRLLRLEPVD